MRVCFICDEYPPGPHGGIGTATQNLARAMAQAGHHVRVVGVYPRSYPAPDYETDGGVRVWRMRRFGIRLGWLVDRFRLFQTVRRWSNNREIDLVEVPDWNGLCAAWPRLSVPVVVRLCGSRSYFAAEMQQAPKRTVFRLEQAALRRSDFWCSKSLYMAERSKLLFGLRTNCRATLYNPVQLSEIGSHTRSKNRVLFSGTLTAKKGILSLIRAWPRVLQACSDAQLHVFGKDGNAPGGRSMIEYLRRELLPVAARGSVFFHGHVVRETLAEALATARLAVFPSYAEGFANAPLEAMAAACPTIHSLRGSGPELIDHGKNGLLIDPDRPDDIAESIVRLLRDDQLARNIGAAGRARVESDFSLSKILVKNEAFYQACLADFRRSRAAGPVPDPAHA